MKRLKIIALALIISITGSVFLKAADAVKTLPPALYQQMKHGKKLDKVWMGVDYDKTKGFKVSAVEYQAESRNGTVTDYMPKALATFEKVNSAVTLQVTITKVTTKSFTGIGYLPGKVTVDGKISDATGKIVAAFTTSGSSGSFGSGFDDYQSACDIIASAIAADLLTKSNDDPVSVIPVKPAAVPASIINSEVLTNDSIVKLVKAGLSEEIIVNKVKTQPTRFDVTVEGLLTLKSNSVSDKIIYEMVLRGQGASVVPATTPSGPVKANDGPAAVVPMTPPIATTTAITDPAVATLCDALTQDNPGKVKDALKKLRDKKLTINAPEVVPKILPCLTHSNPDVVKEACKTLVVVGNQDAVPALIPLLTHERPDIVREACKTLGAIGNKEVIPSIQPLLMNPKVSDQARKTIVILQAKS